MTLGTSASGEAAHRFDFCMSVNAVLDEYRQNLIRRNDSDCTTKSKRHNLKEKALFFSFNVPWIHTSIDEFQQGVMVGTEPHKQELR